MRGSTAERFGMEIKELIGEAEISQKSEERTFLIRGKKGHHTMMVVVSPTHDLKPGFEDQVQYDFSKEHLKRQIPDPDPEE